LGSTIDDRIDACAVILVAIDRTGKGHPGLSAVAIRNRSGKTSTTKLGQGNAITTSNLLRPRIESGVHGDLSANHVINVTMT
jgi:hypothetical protein